MVILLYKVSCEGDLLLREIYLFAIPRLFFVRSALLSTSRGWTIEIPKDRGKIHVLPVRPRETVHICNPRLPGLCGRDNSHHKSSPFPNFLFVSNYLRDTLPSKLSPGEIRQPPEEPPSRKDGSRKEKVFPRGRHQGWRYLLSRRIYDGYYERPGMRFPLVSFPSSPPSALSSSCLHTRLP